jgi:hypothetical protein
MIAACPYCMVERRTERRNAVSEEARRGFRWGAVVLVCLAVVLGVLASMARWQIMELICVYVPAEEQALFAEMTWIVPLILVINSVIMLALAIGFWRLATRSAEADPITAQVASQSPTRISTSPLPAYEIDSRAMERIKQSIAQNRKIEAIKLYREATGAGLKDARDAVLRIEAEMQMSGYC